jgi:hypothetical protein
MIHPGIVLDAVDYVHLPAAPHPVQHHRVQPRAPGVDPRRQPRRPAADDHNVMQFFSAHLDLLECPQIIHSGEKCKPC